MTDGDCATFLDVLADVVANKALPPESLVAIGRGAAALRETATLRQRVDKAESLLKEALAVLRGWHADDGNRVFTADVLLRARQEGFSDGE